MRVILASKSPRRKEFLEKACLDFIIDTVDTEEIFNKFYFYFYSV